MLPLKGITAALENDAYEISDVLVTDVPPIARDTGSRVIRVKGSASFPGAAEAMTTGAKNKQMNESVFLKYFMVFLPFLQI